MAIKGSLKEASLPDVIQLLSLGKKTGCLAVADRQNFGYIYFEEGLITYASIVNRRDRLGDILVASGRITTEQQTDALERQNNFRDKKLGEILVEQGVIERSELEEYIRLQIEEAVYFLFTWHAGTFNFEAGVQPEQDLVVAINPKSLLLGGRPAGRRVEPNRKEGALVRPHLCGRPGTSGFGGRHPLARSRSEVLAHLDGERDVHGLLDQSGARRVRFGEGPLRLDHCRVRAVVWVPRAHGRHRGRTRRGLKSTVTSV